MTDLQIEAWARQVIEDVSAGRQSEAGRVELKREWPTDHGRAAHQLAALANAARGQPVLWIVGVSEAAGPVGVPKEDLANWWPAIERRFDSVAPSIRDVPFRMGDNTVVVLYFETERAPFVVTNSDGGLISHWVPWREGTRVRAANRADLLKLLIPQQKLPSVEIVESTLSLEPNSDGALTWRFLMNLYVVPRDVEPLVIPKHRSSVSWRLSTSSHTAYRFRIGPFQYLRLHAGEPATNIHCTDTEVIIGGPGMLNISNSSMGGAMPQTIDEEAEMTARLFIVGADAEAIVQTKVPLERGRQPGTLRYSQRIPWLG